MLKRLNFGRWKEQPPAVCQVSTTSSQLATYSAYLRSLALECGCLRCLKITNSQRLQNFSPFSLSSLASHLSARPLAGTFLLPVSLLFVSVTVYRQSRMQASPPLATRKINQTELQAGSREGHGERTFQRLSKKTWRSHFVPRVDNFACSSATPCIQNPGRCRMSAGIRLLLVTALPISGRAWLGLSSSKDDATAAR